MKRSEVKKQDLRIKTRERRYGSRPFSKLNKKEQDAVERATREEGVDVDDFNFGFGRVRTDKITKPLFREKDYLDEFRVYDLEKSISEKGFDPNKPVLLQEFGRERLDAIGGNHRTQAVRNLQKRKELPKTFGIPSIIMFPTDERLYDKYW